MFDTGAETMALPIEEKLRFEQGDERRSFGHVSAILTRVAIGRSTNTDQLYGPI